MQHPFRFAISATFTAEPIEPALAFWGRQLQMPFEIGFAPYHQLSQTLADPGSEFARNLHGVNVLLLRLEDLAHIDAADSVKLARIESNLEELIRLIREALARFTVPLLLVLCPPSPDFLADPERRQFASNAARRMDSVFEAVPGVLCLIHEEIQRLYPVAEPFSTEGDRLGRIPYIDLYFAALGTALVRTAHSFFSPPFKLIALDCDNTLWAGICGEDGPDGVVVDPARRELQEFMLEQHEAGMLLAMASKNNEADVRETFAKHPEMPLQLRHFVSWRLNWDPKSANLRSLAGELSVGLDSFILVDDNPKECAEAVESVPDVLTLPLPAETERIGHFLRHIWAFDHALLTEEDRHRNAYYKSSLEFGRELKQASSMESFLSGLDLRVDIHPASADQLARVAQLTQRTNQFNFSSIRRTEAEISALLASGSMECLTIDVSDRFGDYGLTGVVLFRTPADALDIDTLLLSCRVLGRGVEYRVMAYLGDEALRRGLSTVVATFTRTLKNEPARRFLQEIGGLSYRLPAAELRDLRWQPSPQPDLPTANGDAVLPSAPHKRPDYLRIAREFSTPAQILAAIRSEYLGAHRLESTTESGLGAIWSELLRQPKISTTDNFFDLGGHSLLAVLLLVRVRETFGVELSIDDVYEANLTLGDLANKIDAYRAGGPAAYDAIYKEIEALSDDEVKQFLAEEDSGVSSS